MALKIPTLQDFYSDKGIYEGDNGTFYSGEGEDRMRFSGDRLEQLTGDYDQWLKGNLMGQGALSIGGAPTDPYTLANGPSSTANGSISGALSGVNTLGDAWNTYFPGGQAVQGSDGQWYWQSPDIAAGKGPAVPYANFTANPDKLGQLVKTGLIGLAGYGLGGAAGLWDIGGAAAGVGGAGEAASIADIIAAEGGWSALPSSGMAGTSAATGGTMLGAVEGSGLTGGGAMGLGGDAGLTLGAETGLPSLFSGNPLSMGSLGLTGLDAIKSGAKGMFDNLSLKDLVGAGTGLAGYFTNKNLADKTTDAASQYAAQADPFASERPFYQQQLKQSYTDPWASPDMQAARRDILETARRQGASRGTNPIHTEIAAQSKLWQALNQQRQTLGGFTGAGANPAAAGQMFMSALGNANTYDKNSIDQITGALRGLFGGAPAGPTSQQIVQELMQRLGANG